MTVDEAIVQMELLAHTFYVFLNMETDSVNVVYRRNDGITAFWKLPTRRNGAGMDW